MKFKALHRQIRHVEGFEHLLGSIGVVIGRATHQRETGKRDHCINNGFSPVHKEGFYRGPRIEPRRKGGNDAQTPRLKRLDHRIVMGAVARQRIGTHQQNTDRTSDRFFGGLTQHFRVIGNAIGQALMVETSVGVLERWLVGKGVASTGMRIACVAIDQKRHHPTQIGLGPGQPVLQGQKISANILRRARNETQ